MIRKLRIDIGIQLPEKYKENFDVSSELESPSELLVSSIYISGARTSVIWFMRKVMWRSVCSSPFPLFLSCLLRRLSLRHGKVTIWRGPAESCKKNGAGVTSASKFLHNRKTCKLNWRLLGRGRKHFLTIRFVVHTNVARIKLPSLTKQV
jgi:hypothetical protein